MTPDYVIFASGGNDSIALVQKALHKRLFRVAVAYSNTGWASPEWPARIEKFKIGVEDIGYQFHEIPSEGMEALVARKKGFPANRPKFCTYELKIAPAKAWLDTVDPKREAICMVGVRREESAARREWPEFVEDSENHGGRTLWSPLVKTTEAERNELLRLAGWEPLPHRSKECSPCVNANRTDFRNLIACKQVSSVELYNAEFTYLSLLYGDTTPEMALHAYLEGLQPDIAAKVGVTGLHF